MKTPRNTYLVVKTKMSFYYYKVTCRKRKRLCLFHCSPGKGRQMASSRKPYNIFQELVPLAYQPCTSGEATCTRISCLCSRFTTLSKTLGGSAFIRNWSPKLYQGPKCTDLSVTERSLASPGKGAWYCQPTHPKAPIGLGRCGG